MQPFESDAWEITQRGLDLIFVGLNPDPNAVASGLAFSHPSNRFWPVLHQSGFTDRRLAADEGRVLLKYGYGITAIVTRGTRSAAEVSDSEFRSVAPTFERKILHLAPRFIAFLGKRGFEAVRGRKPLVWGRQNETFAGAVAWTLPNPSGLNRSFSIETMVTAYAQLRRAIVETR